MTVPLEVAVELLLAIATGFGVYAAIRADLARLHERSDQAIKHAELANNRLDNHLENHQ